MLWRTCDKIHIVMARTGFNRTTVSVDKRLYIMYMKTGSLVPSPRGMGMRLEGKYMYMCKQPVWLLLGNTGWQNFHSSMTDKYSALYMCGLTM